MKMRLRALSLLLLPALLLPTADAQQRMRRSISGDRLIAAGKSSESRPSVGRRMSEDKLRALAIKAGPLPPSIDQSHRKNFPDPKTTKQVRRPGTYPWHFDITATYFYIGEKATARNPVPNNASSWDSKWDANYGGFDDPNPANRDPKTFAPKALPRSSTHSTWLCLTTTSRRADLNPKPPK